MSFTFTEADTTGEFTRLDPGVYDAKVDKVDFEDNKVKLTFVSAENGERLCTDFLHFSAKAKPFAARKLKIIGLEKVDGKYTLDNEDQLLGKTVTLTLIEDKNPKYLTPDSDADGFGYAQDDIGF